MNNKLSDEQVTQIDQILGPRFKILSFSKGQYSSDYPDHLVIFNSVIVSSRYKKVWHGDLDITKDEEKIKDVSSFLQDTLYVLYESDGKFENSEKPLINKHVIKIDFSENNPITIVNPMYSNAIIRNNEGNLIRKPIPKPTEEEIKKKKELIKQSYRKEDFSVVNIVEQTSGYDDFDDLNFIDPVIFFEGVGRYKSPIHLFFKWLGEVTKTDISETGFDYYVTKETYEEIKDLVKIWLEVFETKGLSDYRKEQSLNTMLAIYGPSHFIETPNWAEEGRLYLRKKDD